MYEGGQEIQRLQKILLNWAQNNLKTYSWRMTSDPYKILISELLLQKTDAKKVERVYSRFIEKWPTISRLHKADVKEIEELVRNIGLFYRAQRIVKMVNQIVTEFDGRIPDSKKALMSLNGVGDYIASAVLCFAFKKRVPIVDTNVIRVYRRIFNLQSSKSRPQTDKRIWEFARKVLPLREYVKFNYALLDFASIVCRAKDPSCDICNANSFCENVSKRPRVR